mgnify:CR=1 FL=1
MKKFLILLLILSSCKKAVYYYPSKEFFEKYSPKEIIIDDLSFQEITDSLSNELWKNKKRLFITLKDSYSIFKISPFTYTGGYIREKNILEIVDDSLWYSANKVSIKELGKHIKLHYENNGKQAFLPDSYKRAFIQLNLDPKDSSEKLKKRLLYIIQVYNYTNIDFKDSIKLNIMIDYCQDKVYHQSIPPPSPIILED